MWLDEVDGSLGTHADLGDFGLDDRRRFLLIADGPGDDRKPDK